MHGQISLLNTQKRHQRWLHGKVFGAPEALDVGPRNLVGSGGAAGKRTLYSKSIFDLTQF